MLYARRLPLSARSGTGEITFLASVPTTSEQAPNNFRQVPEGVLVPFPTARSVVGLRRV